MGLRRGSVRVIATAVASALLAACGTSAHGRTGASRAPATAGTHRPAATTRSTTTHRPRPTTTTHTQTQTPPRPPVPRWHRTLQRIRHAGARPQTMRLPSAQTRVFHAEMQALWAAVRADRPALGLPAFFPAGAYVQVKTIYAARQDWQARLVGEFGLDVGAAHALLGPHPATAHLLGVSVPAADAHWIPPGVCANGVGYYEVPNARMVYRQAGAVHSFGIASMISWRGWWYVVHLGAILRQTSGGEVDAPSAGPGVSVPSSTC